MLPDFSNRSLNQDKRVVSFLERMGTATGRRAASGDADKVPAVARHSVANANAALERLPVKIAAIIGDKTRESAALKHDAARTVGNQTIATLRTSKASIETHAAALIASADSAVGAVFAPNPNRAGIEGEIRAHIRSLATKENGIAEIRKLMNSNPEVASVVCHSPAFLTGIAANVQQSLRFEAIEKHVPEAWEMLEQSVELTELAERYADTVKHVRGTWFDAVADGVDTHVDLNA